MSPSRARRSPWLGASSGPSTAAAAGSSAPCACLEVERPPQGPHGPDVRLHAGPELEADPPLLDEHLQAVERLAAELGRAARKGVSGGFGITSATSAWRATSSSASGTSAWTSG